MERTIKQNEPGHDDLGFPQFMQIQKDAKIRDSLSGKHALEKKN